MDRSFTAPPKSIKRSSSLSQIEQELNFEDSKLPGRKNSKTKPHRIAYRGRMSLGIPKQSVVANKVPVQRKRSGRNYPRFLDEEDKEYFPMYSADTNLKPSPSASEFRCLPVIDRENSATSSADSTRSADSGIAPLSSIENEDERALLYAQLSKLLNPERLPKQLHNLVVTEGRCKISNDYHKSFTIGSKKKQHKFGDVLWLILKAYFAGREVFGCEDSFFEEDSIVFKKRHSGWDTVMNILEYQAPAFKLGSLFIFEEKYIPHMSSVRNEVKQMLTDLEHYQRLFPTRKAMFDFIAAKLASPLQAAKFDERVDVLTAWINTVEDLDSKLEVLGRIFEVDRLPHARDVWPRSNLRTKRELSLMDARPVLNEYVKRSLHLKGMKKLLARVWDLCETSIVKAVLLLQTPPETYAHVVSGARPYLCLDKQMKTRYDSEETSTSKFGLQNLNFVAMNLPSFFPLFHFLLGIRLALVDEWLEVRAAPKLASEELDTLTLESMIEDSRDCVEEAVRVKKHYKSVLQYTLKPSCNINCPTDLKKKLAYDFHMRLVKVFERYLCFVSCWCRKVADKADIGRLFPLIEKEWTAAIAAARMIPNGVETLSATFTSLIRHLMDTLVLEYWDQSVDNIPYSHPVDDISDSDDERTDEGIVNPVVVPCREYNRVIREVKDRAARIFGHLRTSLTDLYDCSGYKLLVEGEPLLKELKERHYSMVHMEESDSHLVPCVVFCNCESADNMCVEAMVRSICESRPASDGKCARTKTLLIFPKEKLMGCVWKGRKVRVSIEDELIRSLKYIRTDVVCVYGLSDPHLFSSIMEPVFSTGPANDVINEQIRTLLGHLVDYNGKLWEYIQELCRNDLVFGSDCLKTQSHVHTTFLHAFTLIFQVHRDISRCVAESSRDIHGEILFRNAVEIMEQWHDLVSQMNVVPSPSVPVWASHAFNFCHYIADPKWSSLVNFELYERFSSCVAKCRLLVLTDGTPSPLSTIGSHMGGKRTSFVHRSHSSNTMGESRRDQLRMAAANLDKKVAEKNVFNLGRIVDLDETKEKFTFIETNNKAAFKWRMLEKIGSGMFSDVYKAYNEDDRCVIAVKKIRVVDKNEQQTVGREIDIFRNLNHKNLVKYYGYQVIQDTVNILMEFCAEGTLESICRDGLDMVLVRRYTNSLLQAIEYMHQHKVVHRDIKPANIFLDSGCCLKLGDFGCSRRLQETSTVVGELVEYVGTPQYMAPEILTYGGLVEGGNGIYYGYGRAVDIWSLGCVVLQMFTGRPPWPTDMRSLQIQFKVGQGERPPVPAKAPAILTNFLDHCFIVSPKDRFDTHQLLQDPFADIHVDLETVFH